jgi:hypothetical protein
VKGEEGADSIQINEDSTMGKGPVDQSAKHDENERKEIVGMLKCSQRSLDHKKKCEHGKRKFTEVSRHERIGRENVTLERSQIRVVDKILRLHKHEGTKQGGENVT